MIGMTQAEKIINRFGGIRPLARAIDENPSTVHAWKASGRIPQWHHITILKAAKDRDIEIPHTEFLSFELEVAE